MIYVIIINKGIDNAIFLCYSIVVMIEKVDRNRRLYEYHLANPKMSYAKLGRVFKHKRNGCMTPLNASAVYRIVKREEKRLDIDLVASGKEVDNG